MLCSMLGQGCTLSWQPNLEVLRVTQALKAWWKHGEQLSLGHRWRCSLNSCRKAQVWRAHAEKLKLECRRSYWWSTAQLQYNPQQDGDASTTGRAPSTAALEWILPHVRGQAVCAAVSGAGEVTHALWRIPEEHEWIPDSWALVPSDCDCSFPLEVRKSLVYFTEAHSWETEF